jgi:hypothetical protein
MPQLYLAADPIEAEIVKDYLASYGIGVRIFGSSLWGGRGDLPVDPYPRLVLEDARDERRARELLREYERRGRSPSIWRCSCGEPSPLHFELCWSCGAVKPR